MKNIDIFQLALGLAPPWEVALAEFDAETGRLDIEIDFPAGSEFTCPSCGKTGCSVHDTAKKTWRHLNFFQHAAYLTARVPRVDCPDCGVKQASVPWARKNTGFTLLFEALVMTMAASMPIRQIAALIGEHDTRLWRILNHYVDDARKKADHSNVRKVGVDETSSKKGHNYVAVFVDLEESKVLFATEGKDASTIDAFRSDLIDHSGAAGQINEFCCDMSPAFISGIQSNFPNAHLTFDKFHVMKILNEAVDEVRRQEQRDRPELHRTRYIWLKNPGSLTSRQRETLDELQISKQNLKTARAYQIRLNFQEFWNQPPDIAEQFLKEWYFWATHSRLEPMKRAAYTIKRHWDGILRWFHSRISNGILEGINSMIQAAKARARGYRSTRNLITMIYLISGKFDFDLPT